MHLEQLYIHVQVHLTFNLSQRGISLLSEIPATRTCAHAGIEPHWCSCLQWTRLDVEDEMATRAVAKLLATINEMADTERSRCELLTLSEVTTADR